VFVQIILVSLRSIIQLKTKLDKLVPFMHDIGGLAV